jgi:hypothetical protein
LSAAASRHAVYDFAAIFAMPILPLPMLISPPIFSPCFSMIFHFAPYFITFIDDCRHFH